jgi:hypothetical protein
VYGGNATHLLNPPLSFQTDPVKTYQRGDVNTTVKLESLLGKWSAQNAKVLPVKIVMFVETFTDRRAKFSHVLLFADEAALEDEDVFHAWIT